MPFLSPIRLESPMSVTHFRRTLRLRRPSCGTMDAKASRGKPGARGRYGNRGWTPTRTDDAGDTRARVWKWRRAGIPRRAQVRNDSPSSLIGCLIMDAGSAGVSPAMTEWQTIFKQPFRFALSSPKCGFIGICEPCAQPSSDSSNSLLDTASQTRRIFIVC